MKGFHPAVVITRRRSHCLRSTTCLDSNFSNGISNPFLSYLSHINIVILKPFGFNTRTCNLKNVGG
jgi:hypothetical protein